MRRKTLRERMSTFDRRERIRTLLEHYQDVVLGIQDAIPGDEFIALMCRAWNHPSYRQLERLLTRMREERRELYSAVSAAYLRSTYRRMMRCTHGTDEGRRCGEQMELHRYRAAKVRPVHRHRGQGYSYHPVNVRVPAGKVDGAALEGAIAWLDANWRGDPSIPEDLLGVFSEAA